MLGLVAMGPKRQTAKGPEQAAPKKKGRAIKVEEDKEDADAPSLTQE